MPVSPEYHDVVSYSVTHSSRRSIPALPAAALLTPALLALGVFLFPLFLISTSRAQISSAGSAHSASVAPPTTMSVPPPTAIGVAPPTGISLGHGGFTPAASGFTNTANSHSPNGSHGNGHHPHHTANGTAYYPYVYSVPVPYAVDTSDADSSNNDDDDDPEYQGGPTIFDRRGSGSDSYVLPPYPGPAHAPADGNDLAESAPEPPQPPTTLVFKDGHQLEVNNYAIVSQTLYDLTPGHPRKIALADLDLIATQKQNDDHGVVFQIPPTPQAN
ncbi:MAG: hypothetical protein WAM04_19960 [Candidatus Sulfotelmatobacter sp.]